jgi:hypothetical protein
LVVLKSWYGACRFVISIAAQCGRLPVVPALRLDARPVLLVVKSVDPALALMIGPEDS